MSDPVPRIVTFLCRWCSGEGADAAGRRRIAVPPGILPIRVACAGRVSADLVIEAFSNGADGVLLLSCHRGDCHYGDGNTQAARRMAVLRAVFPCLGISPERLRHDAVAATEAERFATITREFTETLRTLDRPSETAT